MKGIRTAIDRFLRSPPKNKPFSLIRDPAFSCEYREVIIHQNQISLTKIESKHTIIDYGRQPTSSIPAAYNFYSCTVNIHNHLTTEVNSFIDVLKLRKREPFWS